MSQITVSLIERWEIRCSLVSPRSRPYDKYFNVGSSFGRRGQETPVGRWGGKRRMLWMVCPKGKPGAQLENHGDGAEHSPDLSPLNEKWSEVTVAQSCPTLCDPMGCWNSPGHNTGVGSLSLLQGIFPTQWSNSGLLYCRWILYQLSHQESPLSLKCISNPFLLHLHSCCLSAVNWMVAMAQ